MAKRIYRFDTPADLARFRTDMRKALCRVDINRPFMAPLVPIGELESWRDQARLNYGEEAAR